MSSYVWIPSSDSHKVGSFFQPEVETRILLEANYNPLFNLVFDPKYCPISELFPNKDTRLSYSPKFAAI